MTTEDLFPADRLNRHIPTAEEAAAMEIALMYPKFPPIAEATKLMQTVLADAERSQDFVDEMHTVLETLQRSVDILGLSLKNQADYNLVDKRWMRKPGFMREALESGRLAMELDVRTDKDMTFWVSHATGARASYAPPYIHEMTTEEMEDHGNRFTVEEAFQIFSEYKSHGHKLILELKTLGLDEEKFPSVVAKLKELIDQYQLQDAVAISSLSPGILMAVHESYPTIPLILNGGIVPAISYERPIEQQGVVEKTVSVVTKQLLPADKQWRAFGITLPWVGKLMELVISASATTVTRPDGEGTQTGYALARLPDDLTQVLLEQQQQGKKLGGMVSLSAITILASALEAVGATTKAAEMRRYYSDVINKLGLGKMATTWGQGLSDLPLLGNTLFRQLKPQEQIKVFKKQLGADTLVYTKAPEKFAHELPPFASTYGENVV